MALRGDRQVDSWDISFFMNEVAERGGIVSFSTAGSGAALDQSAALVTYSANESGKVPVGMLMSDMVNKDLTQTHLNDYKLETQMGGKIPLMTRGWAVTNKVLTNETPAGGDLAYLGPSGHISNSTIANVRTQVVGRFLSKKDQDGFAKVSINLP